MNGFADENTQIGIDFDGVIHMCSKGFHDGTIYDYPVDGVHDALSIISKKYKIIIYTAKAKPDRPLINGKTGTELVRDWLEKYDLMKYVSDITSEKPRAVAYIDDRAIRFENWNSCLSTLNDLTIL